MLYYQIVSFLHLFSTAVWLGGSILLIFVIKPATNLIEPKERGKLMEGISKRFMIIAWLSIIILVITGIIKTPEGMMLNTASRFGTVLFIKHILILFIILFGLGIAFIAVPRIKRYTPAPGEQPSKEFIAAQKLMTFFSTANTIMGIIVVLLISIR